MDELKHNTNIQISKIHENRKQWCCHIESKCIKYNQMHDQ